MKEFGIFVLVSIILIFGLMAGYNAGNNIDWIVNVEGDDVNESYTIEQNWLSQATSYTSECEESNDGERLYPTPNGSLGTDVCQWFGETQENQDSDILFLETVGDAREGYVNLTVSAYTYPPEDQNSANETKEIAMDTGTNTYDIGLKNYNYFDIRIDTSENQGSDNQRPHIDRFSLIFTATDKKLVGVESQTARTLTILILLFSLLMFFSQVTN